MKNFIHYDKQGHWSLMPKLRICAPTFWASSKKTADFTPPLFRALKSIAHLDLNRLQRPWQVLKSPENCSDFQTFQLESTVRPATALTSLTLNLILHYFELVPELLLQHYFLRFYLPSTALFWHGSWWKEKCQILFLWFS